MMPALAAGIIEADQANEEQGRKTDQQRNARVAFEQGYASADQRQYQHDEQDITPLRGFAARRSRVGVGNRMSHCCQVKACGLPPQAGIVP